MHFLAGGKSRQLLPAKLLRQTAQETAGLPGWLFDESYDSVGDLAETIALLLPPRPAGTNWGWRCELRRDCCRCAKGLLKHCQAC